MIIVKKKSNLDSDVLGKARGYADAEVRIWVATAPSDDEESKDMRPSLLSPIVFIYHQDFGYVEVANVGNAYDKLLTGCKITVKDGEINRMVPVKTMKLSFDLYPTGDYEVGAEYHSGGVFYHPVMRAFIDNESIK